MFLTSDPLLVVRISTASSVKDNKYGYLYTVSKPTKIVNISFSSIYAL